MTGEGVPPLPEGLVALVATTGPEGPSVIPVSALHRVSARRLLFALAPRRATLARLRADGRTAVALLGPDLSVTLHGTSRVVADPLPGASFVVALRLDVARVRDTAGAHTAVHEGVRWGWRDDAAAARHAEVLAALRALAART